MQSPQNPWNDEISRLDKRCRDKRECSGRKPDKNEADARWLEFLLLAVDDVVLDASQEFRSDLVGLLRWSGILVSCLSASDPCLLFGGVLILFFLRCWLWRNLRGGDLGWRWDCREAKC